MTRLSASIWAAIVSMLGKSENHVPSQPGRLRPIDVVAIQPACCISKTSSPTITKRTTQSIAPVMIRSRR
jgi:hypothetical protein